MKYGEEQEQIALFEWAAWHEGRYPELRLLYHVPNGGRRDKATAARLKRAGVKAGVPDLVLPVQRGGYAGLYIELKVGKNRPTKLQKAWLERLSEQGYRTAVCYGARETADLIEEYLGVKEEKNDVK